MSLQLLLPTHTSSVFLHPATKLDIKCRGPEFSDLFRNSLFKPTSITIWIPKRDTATAVKFISHAMGVLGAPGLENLLYITFLGSGQFSEVVGGKEFLAALTKRNIEVSFKLKTM